MATRAPLDIQKQAVKVGVARQGIKAKAQRLHVNGRHFADAHANLAGSRSRMPLRFLLRRFQDRIGDAHLVHKPQQMRGN
jgi:hypothetical protein